MTLSAGFLGIILGVFWLEWSSEIERARASSYRLVNLLTNIKKINNNFADVIAIADFSQQLQSDKPCPKLSYDAQTEVYGLNIRSGSEHPQLKGTLQVVDPKKFTCKQLHLVELLAAKERFLSDAPDYLARVRYFYPERGNFIYFFNPVPVTKYIFKDNTNISGRLKFIDFYTSKLKNHSGMEDNFKSGFYTDPLSGKETITLLNIVYDLNSRGSHRYLGLLLLDVTKSDFLELISRHFSAGQMQYAAIALVDNQNGQSMSVGNPPRYYKEIVTPLSTRYSIRVQLNPLLALQSLQLFLLSIGAIFLLIVFSLKKLNKISEEHRARSYIDSLTGALNRKFIDHEAERIFSKHNAVVIAFLDCNNFKMINDNLGHDAGDSALKYLVNAINDNIRHGKDYLVRFGGDEFVLILTGVNSEEVVEKIMLRINQKLSSFHHDIRFSVSYGAVKLARNETIASGIKRADALQYQNKRITRQ